MKHVYFRQNGFIWFHTKCNIPWLPVELKLTVGSELLCWSGSNLPLAIQSVCFSFMLGFTYGGIVWLEASKLFAICPRCFYRRQEVRGGDISRSVTGEHDMMGSFS